MQIDELRNQLIRYNNAYRAGKPLISDFEYDNLVEKLRKQAPNDEFFASGVAEKANARMEALPVPMYSLEKVKTIFELQSWFKKMSNAGCMEIIVTPKYDGISLVTQDTKAWTRGDGRLGQRSDAHLAAMHVQPFKPISWGEAIVPKKTFLANPGEYKNARNMVAGLFNSADGHKNPHIADVKFVRYGFTNDGEWTKKSDQLVGFRGTLANGETTVFKLFALKDFDDMSPSLLDDYFTELYKKFGETYKIDGLVFEVNEFNVRDRLGRLPNHNPAYAVAYKRPEWTDVYTTIVTDIEIGISKDGIYNPVIIVKPVKMDGAVVSRCTGYNMRYVFDNHICRGAVIEIARSGDVIPKHLNTVSYDAETYLAERRTYGTCPHCGSTVHWDVFGVNLICENPDCKRRAVSKMVYFFKTLGCEGFEEPTLVKLYDAGITNVDEIIDAGWERLQAILGPAKAETVVEQIYQHKYLPIARLMAALNVFGGKIAEKTAQMMIDGAFTDDIEFNLWLANPEQDREVFNKLVELNGVGMERARVFLDGVRKFRTLKRFKYLEIAYCVGPKAPVAANAMHVCMTGFRDKELEAKLTAAGHVICNSVSKDCTVLVVADLNSNSSKMVKAKQKGIRIVTRTQFANELQ